MYKKIFTNEKKYLKLKVLIGSGKTTPCTILKEHMQNQIEILIRQLN